MAGERDRLMPISTAKPAVRYAGQCRRGAHNIAPSRRPFAGHRMVVPPALQLWRFKISAAISRQASASTTPANRFIGGNMRLFSFVFVAAITMAPAQQSLYEEAAASLPCRDRQQRFL